MLQNSLFSTFNFGTHFTLKKRFVMAPMTTWSGYDTGHLSEEEYDYYAARARGAGMVITATTFLQPVGRGFQGQFYAGDDQFLAGLAALAKTIQDGGAKAILQMFHAGRKANPSLVPEGVTVSASGIAAKREDHVPRALTEEEIFEIIDSFYEGTKRAYQAGFDGVEIHGANTYLIQQFFSPHSNQREDQWGGDLDRRMRFPLAVVKAVLDAADEMKSQGDRPFIVGYRFSPEENSEPGITMADTRKLVDALCQTDLDYLHVSLSHYGQGSIREVKEIEDNDGVLLNKVAQWTSGRKPLIGVGSVFAAADAEKVLAAGADLVAVGRQLLIDPESIEKWEKDEVAYTHYDPSRREALHIPSVLNEVIVSRDNWVPVRRG